MPEEALAPLGTWGGIDESVDDSDCPPNRLRRAENVVFPSIGRTAKRQGFTALVNNISGGGTLSGVKALMSFQKELLASDGTNVHTYVPTPQVWNPVGRTSPCIASRREFTAADTLFGDVAESGNYRATAWVVSTAGNQGYCIAIEDTSNGNRVVAEKFIQTGLTSSDQIALVQVGSSFIAVLSSALTLFAVQFSLLTLAFGATTNMGISDGAALAWDVCAVANGSTFVIAWGGQVSANVRVQSFNENLSSAHAAVVVQAGLPAIAVPGIRATSGETLWVGYSYVTGGNTLVRVANHDPASLAQTTAPWTVETVASTEPAVLGFERSTASVAVLVWSIGNVGMRWAIVNTGGTSGGSFRYMTNWVLVARPFIAPTGKIYAFALYVGTYQSTQCLLELEQNVGVGLDTPAIPVATLSPRASLSLLQSGRTIPGNIGIGRRFHVTNVGNANATTFRCVCWSVSPKGTNSLQVATFDFAHAALWQHAVIGNAIVWAAGTPGTYDGVRASEVGFVHCPPKGTANVVSPGATLYPQVYRYVAVYAQETPRGEIVRSPANTFDPLIADLTAGTAGRTNQVTINLMPIRATMRQGVSPGGNPVVIEIYRTHYDVTTSTMSTTYYRCGSVLNDFAATTVTFTDDGSNGISETNIASTQPVLYTTGDVLENACPPSLRFVVTHKDRLFGIGDDGRTIWYTTAFVNGEQPRWNDNLRIPMSDGDDLVALASKDGKLYAFTTRRIYLIFGDGPSDTGAGSDFSLPQRLPFELGCRDPRRIAACPMGTIFESLRGLYLLTRADEVTWIGARIQRSIVPYPYISSIVHCESSGQIRITARDADAPNANGLMFVWDYVHDAWSTWKISTPAYPFGNSAGQSAVNVNGVYYALFAKSNTFSVAFEDATTKYDNASTWVTLLVQTAWSKAAEQGQYRVHRLMVLADRIGSHKMQVNIWTDYVATTSEVHLIQDTAIDVIPTLPVEQIRISPAKQKCEAISATVQDAAPTSGMPTGESFALQEITMKLRPRRGEFKQLGTGQKV